MHDPQNDESSNFCQKHKRDHFGACPLCHPMLGGELIEQGEIVETLEDIGMGLSTESWLPELLMD